MCSVDVADVICCARPQIENDTLTDRQICDILSGDTIGD
jgi:hypothetical protein